MREMYFRAYDEQHGMLYDDQLEVLHSDIYTGLSYGKLFVARKADMHNDWREFKVMQYTGLNDMNGKRIYEGDIIMDWDDGPGYWEVKWDSEYGCFYIFEPNIWEKFYSDDMIGIFAEGKVIGNIYENPDLLSQT